MAHSMPHGSEMSTRTPGVLPQPRTSTNTFANPEHLRVHMSLHAIMATQASRLTCSSNDGV